MRAGYLLLFHRPEILRMSELNDNSELQSYSSAVLYILSAVTPPTEYVEVILDNFILGIKSSMVKPFLNFD
jgi:proteasome activator subunit 4